MLRLRIRWLTTPTFGGRGDSKSLPLFHVYVHYALNTKTYVKYFFKIRLLLFCKKNLKETKKILIKIKMLCKINYYLFFFAYLVLHVSLVRKIEEAIIIEDGRRHRCCCCWRRGLHPPYWWVLFFKNCTALPGNLGRGSSSSSRSPRGSPPSRSLTLFSSSHPYNLGKPPRFWDQIHFPPLWTTTTTSSWRVHASTTLSIFFLKNTHSMRMPHLFFFNFYSQIKKNTYHYFH